MTPRLDAGPVIAQQPTPIDPDETAEQLERRLSEIGASLVFQALDGLESGAVRALPQDSRLASKAPRLRKRDGLIDWGRSAVAVKNQIRAVQPWPKAFSFWHRSEGPPVRLIVAPVGLTESAQASHSPGEVLEAEGDRLIVATGDGAVWLTGLQPAGKRLLTVDEFLRGYPMQPGQRFGPG
jgi:methionyl-tRNA formyltransferase